MRDGAKGCPLAVECVSDYGRATTHSDDVGTQRVLDISWGPSEESQNKSENKKVQYVKGG